MPEISFDETTFRWTLTTTATSYVFGWDGIFYVLLSNWVSADRTGAGSDGLFAISKLHAETRKVFLA